jgi:acetyl-CoA C-acetyltransferase
MSGRETPVLVGVGTAMRREEDYKQALEPLDLMLEAIRKAGSDSGYPDLLKDVDRIAIPRGRWKYRNPGGAVAKVIGAERAQTVLASVGVLQQTLIADACEDIASGKIASAIVTGADSGYRILRARIAGVYASERDQNDDPDVKLEPAKELRNEAELAAGLMMPVGLYALAESARRADLGLGVSEHREQLAQRYARLSEIASQNSDAWSREIKQDKEISEAGKSNPMQAFPYTRSHCSAWNVDQAAALLFCSEKKADSLGIERSRRIYPMISAESNHMVALSARPDLWRCTGAKVAADALFGEMGITADDIDLIELYSCFPIAMECFANAARIPHGRDLSVTGGMAYAGGPYNNYFYQATVKTAEMLRAGDGRTALLSCVSGIMTKQAFAMWSSDKPEKGFSRLDVTDAVAAQIQPIDLECEFAGKGQVAACTVIYQQGKDPCAVLLLDTEGEKRALIACRDLHIIRSIENEEWVGRTVSAVGGRLVV